MSLFTYRTREPFVGVYHPTPTAERCTVASIRRSCRSTRCGRGATTAKPRRGGRRCRTTTARYVELQAGLFRNQETYAFLEPQETVHFSEYWLPVRDLGGITRANVDAVLHMERPAASRLTLALDVTRDMPDAHLGCARARRGARQTRQPVAARCLARRRSRTSQTRPSRSSCWIATGKTALIHTENTFDRTRASDVRPGPQPNPQTARSVRTSVDDVLEDGLVDELEGRRLAAMSVYRVGLERDPHSLALSKAAGRLAVALTWPDAGTDAATRTLGWLEDAYARNTTDFETRYYLGLALIGAGRSRDARPHFEAAQRFRATRAAATLQLARLFAREGSAGRGAAAGADARQRVSSLCRSRGRSKPHCFAVRAARTRRASAPDIG